MPRGRPPVIPDDGRTTRARRNSPVLAVHTGPGKGRSTAASGMALARNTGFDVAVFQLVGEEDHAGGAADGWAEIARRLADERHDFYVLDEFTYPLKWAWVGRDAPPRLADCADLATEMTKVKHPMNAGRKGQRGLEW